MLSIRVCRNTVAIIHSEMLLLLYGCSPGYPYRCTAWLRPRLHIYNKGDGRSPCALQVLVFASKPHTLSRVLTRLPYLSPGQLLSILSMSAHVHNFRYAFYNSEPLVWDHL